MSERRLRRIVAAVVAAGIWHCAVARPQEAQPAQPAPPIHLLTGKQVAMPVTVENKCPKNESFSVTTDGLPGSLVHAPKPIEIGPNTAAPSTLIIDTTNVAPGLYSGKIVIACVTCGTECKQDQVTFPLQFQIDKDASAGTPSGGQGTSKPPGDESKLVIDEPAPTGAGKGQQPGTQTNGGGPQKKPDGTGTQTGGGAPQEKPTTPATKPDTKPIGSAPQENPVTPGTQPGKTPAGGGTAPGQEKKPGGNGPTTPAGGGNTPATPGTTPGAGGPTTTPGGVTPGGPGGNGPTAPLGGVNTPPPPPGPGMAPEDGLPLPKRPKNFSANTPKCPCMDICEEAREDELVARQIQEDYLKDQAYADLLDSQWRALTDEARADEKEAADERGMGESDDAAKLMADAAAARAQSLKVLDEWSKALTTAQEVADQYENAATVAAVARLKCDDCVALHPDCPATIRAQSDTTENPPPTNPPPTNPPPTNPPGTSTATGGGGTSPPPTGPPPTQEKPKQPTGTTPGDNPTGHTPDNHTGGGGGGTIYGHGQAAQCPEYGRGCIALVVTFMKNDATTMHLNQMRNEQAEDEKKTEEALKTATGEEALRLKAHLKWLKEYLDGDFPVDLTSEFKNAGCKVFAPDPVLDLQPIPEHPTDEVKKTITEHNDAEMYRLNKVIADYRAAVAAGKPEVAIEIVDAHGGPAIPKSYEGTDYERCGEWGNDYAVGTTNTLYRASFHSGNYSAANKNVCSWFNVDMSCYGGLTPKVVDELNNYATSTCQKPSTINCGLHAGWGADGSTASGTSVATAHIGDAVRNANLLRKLIEDNLTSSPAPGTSYPGGPDYQWLVDGLKRIERGGTAYYSDHGYDQDPPHPVHTHFGYPSTAAGAPCTGGQCGK